MCFSFIYTNLKEGNFEAIFQDGEEQIKNLESSKQLEQVLVLCSHFLYNNNSIDKNQLSLLIKVVIISTKSALEGITDLNASDVLKSLHYILANGIRKGMDAQSALALTNEIEPVLSSLKDFHIIHMELMKKIHSCLWNFSLQKCLQPVDSLLLQAHALHFVCLVGENLNEICNNCIKVGKLAEHNLCSTNYIEYAYHKVLKAVATYLKRKPDVDPICIISLNLVLIEYAKILIVSQHCNKFSEIFKPLVSCLESLCDPKAILGFKVSLKIVELAMALLFGKCKEEMATKILKGCEVISLSSLSANTVLIDGLLFAHELCNKDFQSGNLSPEFSNLVLASLLERIKATSKLSPESLLKISELLGRHLSVLVAQTADDSSKKDSILLSSKDCLPTLKTLLARVNDRRADTHIYNIGIGTCNLGVISFKCGKYSLAADFLDVGVIYLEDNYKKSENGQKSIVHNILKKKSILLRDSLRYSGRFEEAMTKTFRLAMQDVTPASDIIPTWIKCKKDAQKTKMASLKDLCIKDVYQRTRCQGGFENITDFNFNVDELVLEELKELDQLSYETKEEQLLCARALMNSDDLHYSLEGSLALTKILWTNTDLITQNQSPTDVAKNILERLQKSSLRRECDESLILEYKARTFFWLYLCNLQIIQEKAEAEVEEKQKAEPLSAQAADMGEEVQPNDACSVRPSTSVTTFATQEATLAHLHKALEFWQLAVKKEKIQQPSFACSDLLSIGFVYKLSGLLSPCVMAFSLLLSLSHKHELLNFWIHGVKELMDVIPELISDKVANRLRSLLTSETESLSCTEYFKVSALSTLAYYYLRNGQHTTGAKIILDCLSNPLMEKRTPAATEVQIGVYYVASHYAFLPHSVLPTTFRPNEPCLFLALCGTRKAIGLVSATQDHPYFEIVCQRHKFAWLHHTTNMWLGQLCYYTAQPRLARAYLRQALTLAEKLALPLRTVELLCTLAEIDFQCDQLDDCRVKIDSIDHLLNVHPSHESKDKNLNAVLSLNSTIKQVDESNLSKKKLYTKPSSVSVYVDADCLISERLRENDQSQDFNLKAPSLELGSQLLVVGQEKRIGQLVSAAHNAQNQCPSSPTIGFREEKFVVRSVVCQSQVAQCSLCSAPELHAVAIRCAGTMAGIHAHRRNDKGAQLCFNQAEADLMKIEACAKEITSNFVTILRKFPAEGLDVVEDEELDQNVFIHSQMIFAKLSLFFHRNEFYCMTGTNWHEMESRSLETLNQVAKLESVVLCMSHPLVLQLILQGHAILRTLKNATAKNVKVPPDEESSVLKTRNRNRLPSSNVKTPVRSNLKTPYKNMFPLSVSQPSATHFRIFIDDSAIPAAPKKNHHEIKQNPEVKNLLSSFGRLTVDNSSVKTSCCSIDSLNSSPFSQVLQLPNKEVEDDVSAKGCTRVTRRTAVGTVKKGEVIKEDTISVPKKLNLNKLHTNNITKNIDTESKENSPIITVKLNPSIRAKSTAASKPVGVKTYGSRRGSSPTPKLEAEKEPSTLTTRATRSRKTTKRL